jgi:hypothetical protein
MTSASVAIDPHEITITPVFKIMQIENIPKSETAGHAVMEMKEMVEIRFAGRANYVPVRETNEFWRREGNQIITYQERWPEQFRQFREGDPQEALGTPLEMLRSFGVTPEQISLCRALRIYSIETLHALTGPAVKSLGMNANMLKEAASAFMADRLKGAEAFAVIEKLRAEIAGMRAASTVLPQDAPDEKEVEAMVAAADANFAEAEAMTFNDLKDEVTRRLGHNPPGNPSRARLVKMLAALRAE